MSRRIRRHRLTVGLLLVTLLAAVGCTHTSSGSATVTGPGPQAQIASFAAALHSLNATGAAALTSDPGTAGVQIASVIKNLAPTALTVVGDAPVVSGGNATVAVHYTWSLPGNISWKYDASWGLTATGSGSTASWTVNWAATVLNPKLGDAQSLALRTTDTSDGIMVDRNNAQLVSPVTVYSVVALPDKVKDLPALAAALTALLGKIDPTVTVASVTAGVKSASASVGYTVTNLRETEFSPLEARLSALEGLTFPSTVRNLPPTKDFAKILLSEVQPVAAKMMIGRSGWRIVSIDASGSELDTLASQAPVPGRNVSLTLDSRIQQSAEAALASTPEPAMLVAIQPSTGGILAVAQNAPANLLGSLALTGEYPPGSTFKIVTATAAFDAKLVTPTTTVDCPGEINVQGQLIHNEGFELGTVPVTTAFAKSCNTTFAHLSTQLSSDALPKAADEYGIGRDFVIPGITVLNGKVTAAATESAKAENGFGQGTVLVTPFAEALMAATAATSNMPTPSIIKGATTIVDQSVPPRSAVVQTDIRTLMRAVVTDGTARILQDAGVVYAKTGTADYSDGAGEHAHAWTVGFRGDVAFAILIVAGNDSKRTNVIADAFLKGFPATG